MSFLVANHLRSIVCPACGTQLAIAAGDRPSHSKVVADDLTAYQHGPLRPVPLLYLLDCLCGETVPLRSGFEVEVMPWGSKCDVADVIRVAKPR